jgi:hypothetical protein
MQLTRTYLLAFCHPDLVSNIMRLLHVNLYNNDFIFNEEFFIQTFGIAMGKSFAPHLANIYLASFDQDAMSFDDHVSCYTRYIDDLFFLYSGTLQDLETFQLYLNSRIPGIKLTFTHDFTQVSFLDLTIYINNYILLTKIFFKPTDSHALLSRDSHHPQHTFKGILKSQFIRYKRLSSLYSDYIIASDILISTLLKRGYKSARMHCMANYIWHSYVPKPKRIFQNDSDRPIYFSLVYNNSNLLLAKTVTDITRLSGFKVTVAWRNNKNLGTMLRHRP